MQFNMNRIAIMGKLIYILLLGCIFSAELIHDTNNSAATRNEYMEDRARGYLLHGKPKLQ